MIYRLYHRIAHAVHRRWKIRKNAASYILPEECVTREIKKLTIVEPASLTVIGDPQLDPFIPISKYYTDGLFQKPDIFVAEINGARVHVGSGLVCTPTYRALADTQCIDRLPTFGPFDRAKPRRPLRLEGAHSTISYCFAANPWHWMIDCLPKLISLERALPNKKVTLLCPDDLTPFQRDSMQCVLPSAFTLQYFPAETWIESETFFWASLASGRCNAFLPPGYLETLRDRIFSSYGLAKPEKGSRRLYISRSATRHRRVQNEPDVIEALQEFGFESVNLENLSFRDQVLLFHDAEIVVGAHGAGLVSTLFSGPIAMLVFYATQKPPNYFHTQAVSLGQQHHYLLHDGGDEDDPITVDLSSLREMLRRIVPP